MAGRISAVFPSRSRGFESHPGWGRFEKNLKASLFINGPPLLGFMKKFLLNKSNMRLICKILAKKEHIFLLLIFLIIIAHITYF